MDACFLSVCLQLVKKPPGVTQHVRTRQFVYVTSEELQYKQTARRTLNTARTCTVQREEHNERSD